MIRDTFDQFQDPDAERGRFGEAQTRASRSTGPRVTGASDLHDFTLILHLDNPNKQAIAVSESEDTPFKDWKWLPRSLIEYEKTGRRMVKVTMPERLAVEKGLL